MGVFFLDLEFVNGNFYLADIFEIALLSHNSKHLFHNYIKLHQPLPRYVQKLTHLNDEFLIENGTSFKKTMSNFIAFLQHEQTLDPTPLVIVAHGGFFSDFPILLSNCFKYNFKNINILKECTFIDSMFTFKNAGWVQPGLDALCKENNLSRSGHSAVNDVYLLKTVFSKFPELSSYRYSFLEILLFTNEKMPLSFQTIITMARESKSILELKAKLIQNSKRKSALNHMQAEKISTYFFERRMLFHFLYTIGIQKKV